MESTAIQTEVDSVEIEGLPARIEVKQLPPSEYPEKVQQVLCLLACGWSQSSIARLAKMQPSAINRIIDHYDPDRKFALTKDERRKFLSKLWEAKASEALMAITPEKLENSKASDLAMIASTATQAVEKLKGEEEKDNRDPYAVLEALGRISVLPPKSLPPL